MKAIKEYLVSFIPWILLGIGYVWLIAEWMTVPDLNPYRHCFEISREYTGKTSSNGKGSTRRETIKRWQCPDGVHIEITYTY